MAVADILGDAIARSFNLPPISSDYLVVCTIPLRHCPSSSLFGLPSRAFTMHVMIPRVDTMRCKTSIRSFLLSRDREVLGSRKQVMHSSVHR